MFDMYRYALRSGGALGFFLPCLLGRLGIGMMNLGIIWLVHSATGSYALAGGVAGAAALAEVACSPFVARRVDRRGQAHALSWAVAVHGIGVISLVVLARTGENGWALIVAGAVLGASIPQYGALSAARWSALTIDVHALHAGFALEAMSNDAAYLLGPTLATVAGATIFPSAGLLLAGTSVVTAGAFLAHQHATDPTPASDSTESRRRGSRVPGRVVAALLVANFGLGSAFGSLQVAVTAFALEHHVLGFAGGIYSAMSLGSLASGYVVGRRAGPPRIARMASTLAILAVGVTALTLAHTPIELAAGLLLPGAAVAPTLVIAGRLTQAAVPASIRTQAFVWQNGASALAVSVSATLSGYIVDHHSPQFAEAVAGAVVALSSATVWTLATFPSRGPAKTTA